MYTCVSGFVEHGESVERAAAREVLEETSVVVAAAELVGSQPWPCGRGASCEVMLGVSVRAAPGGEDVDVHTGGDGGGELETAKWFSRAEVARLLLNNGARAAVLNHAKKTPVALAIEHKRIGIVKIIRALADDLGSPQHRRPSTSASTGIRRSRLSFERNNRVATSG